MNPDGVTYIATELEASRHRVELDTPCRYGGFDASGIFRGDLIRNDIVRSALRFLADHCLFGF